MKKFRQSSVYEVFFFFAQKIFLFIVKIVVRKNLQPEKNYFSEKGNLRVNECCHTDT